MQLINGTYQNGHVRLASPVDWPDGADVEVQLSNQPIGLTEHGVRAYPALLLEGARKAQHPVVCRVGNPQVAT